MEEEVIPILKVRTLRGLLRGTAVSASVQEWVHRFGPESPAFVSVARARVRLFLSEHEGDAWPDTLVYVRVSNVDAVAKEFGVDVEEQPWARECYLTDPDGNRLRVGTPEP